MEKSVRLWSEIPTDERVDAEFLADCGGANDPEWMRRHLDRLSRPKCNAAVLWYGQEDVWGPCGIPPMKGARFCFHHGGPTKTKADRNAVVIARLRNRRGELLLKRDQLDEDIAALGKAIDALSK